MSKHTPGPWRKGRPSIYTPEGWYVATVWQTDDEALNDANASLIAAAPELLNLAQSEDLEWILFQAINGDLNADDPEVLRKLLRIQQMRLSVIAKATGEQS